jgi:Galactose oxidase, central domain
MFPPRFRSAVILFPALALWSPQPVAATPDGAWSSLATETTPYARREYVAIYDEPRDRYVMFGGWSYDAPHWSGLILETWSLGLDGTPDWSPLVTAGGGPGERHTPQWGFDPARQRMIIFGGYGHHYPNGENAYLNDVWELSLDGTPTWTELFPTGSFPSGRLAGASIYDPLRQRFVVFGGTVGATVDVYALDLSGEPAWSVLETADEVAPIAGYGMTTIYDPKRDRMLMFGGSVSDDYFGVHDQVWELKLRGTPKWEQLTPVGTGPCARRSLTSIYDPVRDRMVIFGGWDNLSNDPSSFLSDTWALELDDDAVLAWTQLSPLDGPPIGRDCTTAAYDSRRDRMVVFGGWSGLESLSDSWILDWNDVRDKATLQPTALAQPDVAQLHWDVEDATGISAAIFRRQEGTEWSSIALIDRDGAGDVAYEDHDVVAGQRYAYLAAVPSQRGADFGGEVWVDVPSTISVDPNPLAFALHRVAPNPVLDHLRVSFVLPSAAPARLSLYDVAGRQVATREVGSLGPGVHQVELAQAGSLGRGLYFLKLEHAGRELTQRVTVLGAYLHHVMR